MFYIRVKEVVFEVNGTRTIPKTWSIACEHTGFKGICIKCAKSFAESINSNLTGKRYITNWESIKFLN